MRALSPFFGLHARRGAIEPVFLEVIEGLVSLKLNHHCVGQVLDLTVHRRRKGPAIFLRVEWLAQDSPALNTGYSAKSFTAHTQKTCPVTRTRAHTLCTDIMRQIDTTFHCKLQIWLPCWKAGLDSSARARTWRAILGSVGQY